MSLETYLQKHPELEQQETDTHNYDTVEHDTPVSPSEPVSGTPSPQKTKRGMWTIVILLLVLILLGVTCPSQTDHKEALTSALKEKFNEEKNNIDNPLVSLFGDLLVGTVLDSYLEGELNVQKYLVLSIGKVTTKEGETKIVSLGILNHVFTFLNKQGDSE